MIKIFFQLKMLNPLVLFLFTNLLGIESHTVRDGPDVTISSPHDVREVMIQTHPDMGAYEVAAGEDIELTCTGSHDVQWDDKIVSYKESNV